MCIMWYGAKVRRVGCPLASYFARRKAHPLLPTFQKSGRGCIGTAVLLRKKGVFAHFCLIFLCGVCIIEAEYVHKYSFGRFSAPHNAHYVV